MKYKMGLDISSIAYFVILERNKIIDMCQVPIKTNIYKDEIKQLKQQIEDLKPCLKIKGQKGKTQDKINILKRQITKYEDNDTRNVVEVLEWLKKYSKDVEICNVEKPILQSATPTSIISLTKMSEYLGIAITLLTLAGIKHNILSIQEWRANFDYVKPSKTCEDKRLWTKNESIRIAEELIVNIKDHYILPRCKTINTDICESALLALL